MAENVENKEEATEEAAAKSYTEEQVQKMIQNRVKNLSAENDSLKSKIEQSSSSPVATQVAAPESTTSTPPGVPSLSPQDQQAAQQDRENQENLRKQQQAFSDNSMQVIQKMAKDDPEFAKLAAPGTHESGIPVPADVVLHVTNSYSPDTAKKILKKFLTDDTANAKLMRSLHLEQHGTDPTAYSKYMQQLLGNDELKTPDDTNMPDLSGESGNYNDSSEDNIDDYIKNKA